MPPKDCPKGKTGQCVKAEKTKKPSSFNPIWNCSQLTTSSEYKKNVAEMNKKVFDKLLYYHDRWVAGKDMYALMKANYLIDFYCSNLVSTCDDNDPDHNILSWISEAKTYDQMIGDISYRDGLKKVSKFVGDLVSTIAKRIERYAKVSTGEKLVTYKGKKPIFDWKTMVEVMDTSALIKLINDEIKSAQEYYASGWGMYRLINMKIFTEDKKEINRKPCSCICNSLLAITILCALGFPREHVYVQGQKIKAITRKKQTHWAMACQNPVKTAFHNIGNDPDMKTVFQRKADSSQAFAAFTRDIIHFYDRVALVHYKPQKSYRYDKEFILNNLRNMYDRKFEHIIGDIKTA